MHALVEFLLARIAEDEANANRYLDLMPGGDLVPVMRRLQAECEAKRRIIERVTEDAALYREVFDEVRPTDAEDFTNGAIWGIEYALLCLASVYAGHPDYREEWRP